MSKVIKLSYRIQKNGETIEKPVYFNVDNIVFFEQFELDGRKGTTLTLVGNGNNAPLQFKVMQMPEEINHLINS